ncbi:hypothetical protein C8J56DRAFT_907097 [Mycena floridula]|nr:hypothetical protein C8J56DRAFT_907097 [Mycena floridula]
MPAVRNVSTAARASRSLPIPLSFPPISSVQDTVLNDPNGVLGLMRQVWKTFKDHKICLHFKADVQELVVFVWQQVIRTREWKHSRMAKISVLANMQNSRISHKFYLLSLFKGFCQKQRVRCVPVILDHVLMVLSLATMAYPCYAIIATPESKVTWEDFTQYDAVDLSEVEQILLTTNSSSPVCPALTPTAAHWRRVASIPSSSSTAASQQWLTQEASSSSLNSMPTQQGHMDPLYVPTWEPNPRHAPSSFSLMMELDSLEGCGITTPQFHRLFVCCTCRQYMTKHIMDMGQHECDSDNIIDLTSN